MSNKKLVFFNRESMKHLIYCGTRLTLTCLSWGRTCWNHLQVCFGSESMWGEHSSMHSTWRIKTPKTLWIVTSRRLKRSKFVNNNESVSDWLNICRYKHLLMFNTQVCFDSFASDKISCSFKAGKCGMDWLA